MHVQETRVREIMTSPVVVVHKDADLAEVQSLMEAHNVRRLPVVDDEGRLVGIVSQGDLREATAVQATVNPYAPEASETWLTVEEIMTPNPITITPDEPIWRVAELFIEHKIGGLPVVDEKGDLQGIVTESDVLRLVVEAWRSSREEPTPAVDASPQE
ncbi:MAG: CBS domain-containing protein [Chloroflexi bacterium]|nr:CBS domain-containing protein [Chloroflexota bacterium]